jgi:hypothetical protein
MKALKLYLFIRKVNSLTQQVDQFPSHLSVGKIGNLGIKGLEGKTQNSCSNPCPHA